MSGDGWDPAQRPKTLQSQLRELEAVWQPAARSVSLLAELELDASEIEQALRLIGTRWRLVGGLETNAALVLRTCPAVFAAALSGSAGLHYREGTCGR